MVSNCISSLYSKKINNIDINAMNLFLADGITGNLRNEMKIYFADIESRKYIVEDKIEVLSPFIRESLKKINILESYYYLRKNEYFMEIAKKFGSFMLDSGAFTFMQGNHSGCID